MGAGDGAVEPAKTLLLPYLQRADELQKHDPLVAYYCRLYAMERGLKVPAKERSKTMSALLVSLMNQLEKDKKTVKLSPDDNLHVEGFALGVFSKADKQDRAGRADLNTAKTFYAASIFFEVLNQFGELQPEIEQKQKYAVWKAADIRKALSEGRKPEPGPPGGDEGFSLDDGLLNQQEEELPRIDISPPDHAQNKFENVSPRYPQDQHLQHSVEGNSTADSYYYSPSAPAHAPTVPDLPSSHPIDFQPEHFRQSHPPEHFQPDRWDTGSSSVDANNASPFAPSYPTPPGSTFYPNSSFPPSAADYQPPASYPSFNVNPYQAQQYPSPPSSTVYDSTPASSAPLARTTSAPAPTEYDCNYKPPPERISEAHKASRFAVSALAFDDVPTAISYLRRSLELLTSPSATL